MGESNRFNIIYIYMRMRARNPKTTKTTFTTFTTLRRNLKTTTKRLNVKIHANFSQEEN